MAKRNLKLNYWGFFGFMGFMGFENPIFFLYFAFFLFFLIPPQSAKNSSSLIEKQAKEKEEHLQKIIDFISNKDKITNDDIQKLLGVSDATATRYLDELEKQGKLRQKGQDKGVFYEKVG